MAKPTERLGGSHARRVAYRFLTRLLRIRWLWWGPRRPRAFVYGATALLVVSGALLTGRLVTLDGVERECAERPFTCSMATSFISTAAIASVVSLVWIGGVSQWRALRYYRARIAADPGESLALPLPAQEGPIRRDAFLYAVVEELRSSGRTEPVLIEADSGTGKTMTLSELAQVISSRGLVPVVCTFRARHVAQPPEDALKTALVSAIDPLLTSPDHGDKIWRRLRRSGQLVLLVDALDEAVFPDEAPSNVAVRRLFDRLAQMGRTVVTSRPHVVPAAVDCSRFELPGLALDEAFRLAQHHAGPAGAALVERGAIERVQAHETPFFATLLGRLAASGAAVVVPSGSVDRARLVVLDRVVESCPAGARSTLSAVALGLLALERYEAPVPVLNDWCRRTLGAKPLAMDALALAQEADLLRARQTSAGEVISFAHPILLPAFASHELPAQWPVLDAVLASSPMPEAHAAITWAALRDGVSSWVARLRAEPEERWRVTLDIARICSAADHLLPDDFVDRVTGHLMPVAGQHELIDVACRARMPWALDLLAYLLTESSDYGVRWRAAEAISTYDPGAARVWAWPRERVEALAAVPGAERGLALQEGVLWFGPSLTANGTPAWMASVADLVTQASVADCPGALGAESSLAQGLKLAAYNGRGVDVDLIAWVASNARFWFARMEAALAVGFLGGQDASRLDPVLTAVSADRHPLVRAAGRLARDAVVSGNPFRHVWLNEQTALQEPIATLDPGPTLVLGDVVLLLNLSNNADQARRDRNGKAVTIPHCMSDAKARSALEPASEGCPPSCPFGLCPYRPAAADHWSRGSLPESFCRSVRHAATEVGPPEWYRGSTRSYIAFWRTMERHEH